MSSSTQPARLLGALADVTGRVIAPDDSSYDAARAVFYGGIDKRPAAIVQVENTSDVARVIAVARDDGFELAVRSGGHSPSGYGVTDGGIVLDVRRMSKVEINAKDRTAWVEAGATALEVTEAAAEHGLAVGFGDSGSVGVSGITLSGGVGFLVRRFGLTIDSLLAADVVTADGKLRLADAEQHPDLFWAIRGGGGNFGVATRFQFQLHELREFTGGILVLPATPETIAGFAAAALSAREELSTIANIMPAPPMPFIPAEVRGKLVIFGMLAYAGDDESARRALAPFRALATPHADLVKPTAYQTMFPPEDPNMKPLVIGRTTFVDAFDSTTARTIYDYLSKSGAGMRVAQLRPLGGAAARVPNEATAYAHRARRMIVNVAAFYTDLEDRERSSAWTAEFSKAVQPDDAGAYAGFLASEGEGRVRSAYPGSTWERLARIKATYDPTNLFRLNQNIPPAS